MTHTALDSLLFLNSASSLLDWCDNEVSGINGNNPDLEAVGSALFTFQQQLRAELDTHGGWRSRYSTGHPVNVGYEKPGVEPDPDGGPDRIVLHRYIRTGYPDGGIDHPSTRSGDAS